MKVRLTTITENSVSRPGLLAEWGLSIFIETEKGNFLLDTGGEELTAAYNAQRLGKDLSSLDKIIISHGHMDHTGGLVDILKRVGKPVEIIAHPEIWADKYGKLPNEDMHYTGVPHRLEKLLSLGARFNLTTEPVRVTDDIMTTGEVKMQTEYEDVDSNLFIKVKGELMPDTLPDDLALIINTGSGLAVVTGCAHRGIINTLHHAQSITGVDYIHTVIGGTHLLRASEERMVATIEALKSFGLQRLGVSHCTGALPAARLAQEFGEIFFFNNAGTTLEIE
ncbi:MAG: MBL fold metallo-hydrolase [Deltaproteobacteria bacterium]|nr:MBL fold metallo-hydrolase [Deltaproteobacteria bacterium]